MSEPVNNCRLDLEDRGTLAALAPIPREFATFSRPPEVGVDWHKTEDQGQIGSCQGNDLTSCLERLQFVRTLKKEEVEQLSRIFAYVATQKIDGLLGQDQGSTISGGVKLALRYGVCPESMTGYPKSYPSAAERTRILAEEHYRAGEKYKAVSSWQVPDDPDEAMNFIGGGGSISFGIVYYTGLIPADRIVRTYRAPARGPGHAMAALGYARNGNIKGVNSHRDGPFEIMPDAWRSMMRHSYTAAVGLVGTPEPTPVDWTKDNYKSVGRY